MSDKPDEPKIVVDEDWKTKVQAEKQAAEASARTKDAAPPEDAKAAGRERPTTEIPPASFGILVSSLATQALAAMGQFADPDTGHPVVRPDVARHYIDTLDMLEQKTKGNLTAQEAEMMTAVLHQLRMLYVTTRSQPAEEPPADQAS